jgi:hypothetical protein
MLANAHFQEIDEHLSRWLARLRLRDALMWSLRGLMAGLAVGLGLSLVARLRPLLPVSTLVLLSAAFALSGLALALAAGYFWPRPRLIAARYFDRLLELAERTSTALELAASTDSTPEWLIRDQWADAAAAARNADPRGRLPFAIPRSDALILSILVAALALSLYLPNPQQITLAREQAVDAAVAEQVKQIEALREEIENDPNLTDEQKEELTKPLEDAQEQLKNGDLTQEQAVQILTQTGEELRQLADPNAIAQADALEQAGEGLSQNGTTQPVGEALSNGDLQGAAEALANIDPSQMTEAERQALADQLEQTAQQLESTNPELAEKLREAADALRRGDVEAARSALQEAGRMVSETGRAAEQARAASEAASRVDQAQRAVAQAGGSQQGQQGQGQQGQGQQGQGQQGQGQGQGQQGQGQGNGQGQQGGQDGQGQGDGQGSGPEGQDSQQGDPNSAGTGGTRGGESSYEVIYSPYNVDSAGEDVTVDTNEGDPGDEIVDETTANPSDSNDPNVPYNEVYADYADAADSAVESGDVPTGYEDIVKNYFTSLDPEH